MTNERILDCQGLACPQPVITTKDSLAELNTGETLHVIVDNETARSNVERFAISQGQQVEIKEKDGVFHLLIAKEKGSSEPKTPIACEPATEGKIAIYITSETMGRGDDELGQILMGAYLDTLTNFAKEISHIILINSGVKLAVDGAKSLDNLLGLENMDVEILACGTCLNHFEVKDKLKVGEVSNMFTIFEVLSAAGKILSP